MNLFKDISRERTALFNDAYLLINKKMNSINSYNNKIYKLTLKNNKNDLSEHLTQGIFAVCLTFTIFTTWYVL